MAVKNHLFLILTLFLSNINPILALADTIAEESNSADVMNFKPYLEESTVAANTNTRADSSTPSTTTTVETDSGKGAAGIADPNAIPPNNTVDPASTIEIQYQNEKNLFLPRFSNYIALYKPSYILPFYYTTRPYYSVYQGEIPDNQQLKHEEFKAQLSVYLPLIKNLFYNRNLSINVSYTQLIYWQIYTHSPWFRESNYEPTLSLRARIVKNIFGELTIDHQSNGRGGTFERSWNRLIGTFEFSTEDLFIQVNGWILLLKGTGANLYNPDIAHYLGYDKFIVSYRLFHRLVLSVEANNIESGFTRGFFMFTAFYPFTSKFGAYAQYFNGYGQSLIEYNHKTQGIGIGIALNDWQ